jgi:hypothetical protein
MGGKLCFAGGEALSSEALSLEYDALLFRDPSARDLVMHATRNDGADGEVEEVLEVERDGDIKPDLPASSFFRSDLEGKGAGTGLGQPSGHAGRAGLSKGILWETEGQDRKRLPRCSARLEIWLEGAKLSQVSKWLWESSPAWISLWKPLPNGIHGGQRQDGAPRKVSKRKTVDWASAPEAPGGTFRNEPAGQTREVTEWYQISGGNGISRFCQMGVGGSRPPKLRLLRAPGFRLTDRLRHHSTHEPGDT